MTQDERFMQRAIDLAKSADARVFPNPYVGAVIVHNNQIIGEGFHQVCGEAHAEVNAIKSVENPELLKESTIFVTLEPCAHYGKTPPCADLLVKHHLKRVVIGSLDPFALVNGAGIRHLQQSGIAVEVGVLKEACDAINERFFTFHRLKRPYIVLKWAESQDGFVAPDNQTIGERVALTGLEAHRVVHEQRAHEHAILIGKNTALLDNPELTVRLVEGVSPMRFVLDAHLTLPRTLKLFNDHRPTYVLNKIKAGSEGQVTYVKMHEISAESICSRLYEMNILSLYVEGGPSTQQQFIDSNLWDRIYRFQGCVKLQSGPAAPRLSMSDARQESFKEIGEDQLWIYNNLGR